MRVLSHFFRERRKLGAATGIFARERIGVLRHLLALRQMLGDNAQCACCCWRI